MRQTSRFRSASSRASLFRHSDFHTTKLAQQIGSPTVFEIPSESLNRFRSARRYVLDPVAAVNLASSSSTNTVEIRGGQIKRPLLLFDFLLAAESTSFGERHSTKQDVSISTFFSTTSTRKISLRTTHARPKSVTQKSRSGGPESDKTNNRIERLTSEYTSRIRSCKKILQQSQPHHSIRRPSTSGSPIEPGNLEMPLRAVRLNRERLSQTAESPPSTSVGIV